MKIRYLSLLTTLVFLGFTVSAFAGKPVYSDYKVVIAGAVYGGSAPPPSEPWGYDGNQVYSVRTHPGSINLNYFRTHFGARGENCFGDLVVGDPVGSPPPPQTPFGGFLRKYQKETATGMFWFHGFTGEDEPTDRKAVLYLLKVTGVFKPSLAGWPDNKNIFMEMPNWELTVENQGKNVALRSCEDSGIWTVAQMMMVSVVTEP